MMNTSIGHKGMPAKMPRRRTASGCVRPTRRATSDGSVIRKSDTVAAGRTMATIRSAALTVIGAMADH
ncbi:hypothetical protein D3C83_155610 [compost metagenome]